MSRHARLRRGGRPAKHVGSSVYLRFLTEADAPALHELRVRNRSFFEPYEPVVPDDEFTLEVVRERIRAQAADRRRDRGYTFGIFRRDDDALVGHVTLSAVFRRAWQNANLGYSVAEEWGGRGYATEAVRLALAFAFAHAGLHRVQAAVMTDNPRSARVLAKAGFRSEGLAERYLQIGGVWRDHEIYALTREDWELADGRALGEARPAP